MELGFDFKLDDFQQDAVDYICDGKSVVVCAPTGAGKTAIAEHAIHQALKEDKRVFYTTPLKALSNQKFNDFSRKYGEEKTGLLTGDISINREAQIVVMTTEVFRNMLYGTNLGKIEENLQNVQYVILDEVHYMNDEQRGTVWEESIIYCPNNVQLIALSATVANSDELTEWMNTVHGRTELVYTDFRPVPLRHYYYSDENPKDIFSLFAPGGKLNSKIRPASKKDRFSKRGQNRNKASVSNLVSILHKKEMLPAIYFTFSRKKCDQHMQECAKLNLLTDVESKQIIHIVDEFIQQNPYLAKNKYLECLYSGVASHHAGLLPGWKVLVENLFKQGLIKVVFATETLAAGINMPARSTVISSISKRCDEGHRILTASEFLQMSGRAGRRGMDKVGHVTVVGSHFNHPDEVAELASSIANPLESKFSSSYSMVLNLLQRFTMQESRELILKSFGYYASTTRLKPLYDEQKNIKKHIDGIENYNCKYSLTAEDLLEYNKIKNQYVQYRKLTQTLKKQAKQSDRKDAPEVLEYKEKTQNLYSTMENIRCHYCKLYKKHLRDLDIKERFERKYKKITKAIDYEKDIYWQQFVNLSEVLEKMGYLHSGYPTEKGVTTAAIRTENELFFSEIIFSGILDELSPSELSGLLCALITEEGRNNTYIPMRVSKPLRKAFHESREIMKKIWRVQRDNSVNMPMNLNLQFSPLIEAWVEGMEWEDLITGLDIGEGDIVRTFKRTIDLLRQLTIIPGVPESISKTASIAIDCINRDPVSEDF